MLRKARIILSVVIAVGVITAVLAGLIPEIFIFWILRKYCQIVSTDWRIYSLYRH